MKFTRAAEDESPAIAAEARRLLASLPGAAATEVPPPPIQ
jgi:hypothetical protein